ncbi:MAG TPA: TIM barrel protein [Anaerolineales bacterium]|nr:TIM barrel protein [Anaerolineales bacterium]
MSQPDSFVFGTVGSPRSMPPKPGGSVGAVQHMAHLGLMALELGWVQSVRVTESTCDQIRQAAAAMGVSLSVHAPYYINLNAGRAEWPKARRRLMDAAHYGNLAGATEIVFHPGSYFEASPEVVLKKALPRLQACLQDLRRAGNPVRLRPETMGKSAMLGSLEDVVTMSQEVEGVEPCLDFAHLHARPGDGSMNSYEEWLKALQTYQQRLGADSLRRLHIHLSGIEYGPKGERKHLRLVDSDLDLAPLLRALNDLGCGGRVLCESPVMEEDALLMKATWEQLAGG